MSTISKGQKLQEAYRQHMKPYEQHIQFAVTFTLKQKAKISVKRFDNYGDERYEFWMPLTDDALNSTIQYFLGNLRWELYGNSRLTPSKRLEIAKKSTASVGVKGC